MDAMTTTTTTDEQSCSNKPSLDPVVAENNPESLDDDEEDRLSALPEDILHRILSYLYMTEVIKTSLLSTRWRNLWKSHPLLKLHPSRSSKFGGIMDFIEHVLLLRDHHSSHLKEFRLNCRVTIEVDRFLDSIVTAVNQGVEVISTNQRRLSYWNRRAAGITTSITLNPCTFDSGVVSVFMFAVTDARFRIQIPLSMCSSTHLRTVFLHGIKLPEGDSNKELHLICPILEKLFIRNCSHQHLSVLSISTPKLETLIIYNYLNSQTFLNLHGKCILEISTPKLKSFKYFGYCYVDYTFKVNLPFLTDATVQLCLVENTDVERETIFLRSIKILKAISNAKSLWMDRFEIYSWAPNTLRKEVLRNPCTGLRDLTLRSIPSLSSVRGMTYLLLTTCDVLETFVWEVHKGDSVKEDEGEEHEDVMLSEGSFSHLKLVKTMNLRGHKNELIFLRFLMKSAVGLEEMIITTANPNKEIADDEIEELRNYCPSTKLTFKIN